MGRLGGWRGVGGIWGAEGGLALARSAQHGTFLGACLGSCLEAVLGCASAVRWAEEGRFAVG